MCQESTWHYTYQVLVTELEWDPTQPQFLCQYTVEMKKIKGFSKLVLQ